MTARGDQAPDLTLEDEQTLDRIWDSLPRLQVKQKSRRWGQKRYPRDLRSFIRQKGGQHCWGKPGCRKSGPILYHADAWNSQDPGQMQYQADLEEAQGAYVEAMASNDAQGMMAAWTDIKDYETALESLGLKHPLLGGLSSSAQAAGHEELASLHKAALAYTSASPSGKQAAKEKMAAITQELDAVTKGRATSHTRAAAKPTAVAIIEPGKHNPLMYKVGDTFHNKASGLWYEVTGITHDGSLIMNGSMGAGAKIPMPLPVQPKAVSSFELHKTGTGPALHTVIPAAPSHPTPPSPPPAVNHTAVGIHGAAMGGQIPGTHSVHSAPGQYDLKAVQPGDVLAGKTGFVYTVVSVGNGKISASYTNKAGKVMVTSFKEEAFEKAHHYTPTPGPTSTPVVHATPATPSVHPSGTPAPIGSKYQVGDVLKTPLGSPYTITGYDPLTGGVHITTAAGTAKVLTGQQAATFSHIPKGAQASPSPLAVGMTHVSGGVVVPAVMPSSQMPAWAPPAVGSKGPSAVHPNDYKMNDTVMMAPATINGVTYPATSGKIVGGSASGGYQVQLPSGESVYVSQTTLKKGVHYDTGTAPLNVAPTYANTSSGSGTFKGKALKDYTPDELAQLAQVTGHAAQGVGKPADGAVVYKGMAGPKGEPVKDFSSVDPDDWGRATYAPQLSALSSDQKAGLVKYTTNAGFDWNAALRGVDKHGNAVAAPTGSTLKQIQAANAGLWKMKAPETIVVHRGVGTFAPLDAMFDQGLLQPGAIIRDKGFGSGAIRPTKAWPGTQLVVIVPKGGPGAYVDAISANSGEKEFLMPAGVGMRVKSTHWDPTNGRRVIITEMIVPGIND